MTVSGVLSGLLGANGAGFALARAASFVRTQEVGESQPTEPSRSVDGHDPEKSGFDTEDTVELSAAAIAEAPHAESANVELTEEQQEQVDELKERDREVRAHEQAHLSAAGAFAQGGATFEYETGPDGQRYAVGGEVSIDATPIEGDPAATIAKMEQVRAAALAPGDPSAQDRSVAAQAAAAIQEARVEQTQQQTSGDSETASSEVWQASDPKAPRSGESPRSHDRRFDPGAPTASLVDTYA